MQQPTPLIYACSGHSNRAQLANDLAIVLDREGHATMGCTLGLSCDVPDMVAQATSGRPVCVIDGCEQQCASQVLARHKVQPQWHIQLADLPLNDPACLGYSLQDHYKALKSVYRQMGIIAVAS